MRIKHVTIFLLLACSVTLSAKTCKCSALKIISLAPNITEQLYMLGAEDKIVGVTNYCKHPKEAQNKTKVGQMTKPSIEKIISLKPDMVFATKEDNSKDIIYKLRELNINVIVFNETKSYKDIKNNFMLLAKMIGEKDQALSIIDKIDKRLKIVRKRSSKIKNKPKVFLEISHNPIFTVSKNTFINDIIDYAGGTNIVKTTKNRYPRYSEEEVASVDPDFIFVVSMDKKFNNPDTSWQRFKELKAVQNNNVIKLEAEDILRPSPYVFIKATEKMFEIFKRSIIRKREEKKT